MLDKRIRFKSGLATVKATTVWLSFQVLQIPFRQALNFKSKTTYISLSKTVCEDVSMYLLSVRHG
jgi:hypothetical protein